MVINFNYTGDVIYATLRRDIQIRRQDRSHDFCSFLTVDSNNYTDIATTSVDRPILHLAMEPQDALISVVAQMDRRSSVVKLYEIGRQEDHSDDVPDL